MLGQARPYAAPSQDRTCDARARERVRSDSRFTHDGRSPWREVVVVAGGNGRLWSELGGVVCRRGPGNWRAAKTSAKGDDVRRVDRVKPVYAPLRGADLERQRRRAVAVGKGPSVGVVGSWVGGGLAGRRRGARGACAEYSYSATAAGGEAQRSVRQKGRRRGSRVEERCGREEGEADELRCTRERRAGREQGERHARRGSGGDRGSTSDEAKLAWPVPSAGAECERERERERRRRRRMGGSLDNWGGRVGA